MISILDIGVIWISLILLQNRVFFSRAALYGSSQYTVTRDKTVKQIHSHNDYWRDIPLFTALSYGVQSVEADVWLYNKKLLVGHHAAALSPNITLQSLYIENMVDLLVEANQYLVTGLGNQTCGLFDTDTEATLYFFIDVKTESNSTFQTLISELQPLRSRNWLTSYSNGTVKNGPITIIGTGNTPRDYVKSLPSRDFFVDGDFNLINSTNSNVSPIVSGSLKKQVGEIQPDGLNSSQLAIVKNIINSAHAKGIKTRFWDTPSWPIVLRNKVWSQLKDAGTDFLNADDLLAASKY